MFRKLIFSILIITTIFIPTAMAYTDDSGHWAEKNIEYLSRVNIIKGYIDGTFRPDNNMTRAEFITVVNRLIGASKETNKYIPDNSSKSWYYSEIKKAVQAGIIKGDENGYVHPDREINREEAVTILARAFSIKASSTSTAYSKSSDISNWAKESFSTFILYGYIKGYEDGSLRPQNPITRAEVVTVIRRLFSEMIFSGNYSMDVDGNVLVSGKDITLSNMYIAGNLIIAERAEGNVKLNNVDIKGNLILRGEIDLKKQNIIIGGETIKLYETLNILEPMHYKDEEYGIVFSIPDGASVETEGSKLIDYTKKDLILVKVTQSDEFHFLNLEATKKKVVNYAGVYKTVEQGKIGNISYVWYDGSSGVQIVMIKRYDIVYTLIFYNVSNNTIIDSVINSIKLLEGSKVNDHQYLIYNNPKLKLKFRYIDYIGVDDSYNTGVVFEGDKDFKLFIQINNITDLDKYSMSELQTILGSLAKNDGQILSSKTLKIQHYDAIEFIVKNNEKLSKSLYVIVGNNLYNFIFTGEETKVNSIGFELFDEVTKSLEI